MASSRKARPWFLHRKSRGPFALSRNRRRPRLEQLEAYLLLTSSTYAVTTTVDDGLGDIPGTLSYAIDQLDSGAISTPATINFHIGTGPSGTLTPETITPTAPEPTITKPVTITGLSQYNELNPIYYGVRDAIQIDGGGAGTGANGLVFGPGSDGSTLIGISVTGFSNDGVLLESGSNTIVDDDIGLDYSGDYIGGNGEEGVAVTSADNTIGGTSSSDLNVLSDNGSCGVAIYGTGATGNVVIGNYIGTNKDATAITDTNGAPTGNGTGVGVFDGATGNVIGGTGSGDTNVISGNILNANPISDGLGVIIETAGTDDNVVEGNLIGTDYQGLVALGNDSGGVQIATQATGNTIGGVANGAANLIAGNITDGASIYDASGNVIEDNDIGTNADGYTGLGNGNSGIRLSGGATDNTINANITADNGFDGVTIEDPGTSGNLVENNVIGTNAATGGVTGIGNSDAGVAIFNSASGNTLTGNLVTGNGANGYGGIDISGASDNVVAGNTISGNRFDGVDMYSSASGNTIGGSSSAQGNIITSNGGAGIFIFGSGTTGNLVAGDYIGTDAAARTGIGNGAGGMDLLQGASGNTVRDDTIADNDSAGIFIAGSGTTGNLVIGDTITGNANDGLDIASGATSNTIGGITLGDADVISSNRSGGVGISGPGTSGNVVEGDFIGTDAAGDTGMGNALVGVTIDDGATGNTIGGAIYFLAVTGPDTMPVSFADIIASNGAGGIDIENPGTSYNVVEGDYIGTNGDAATDLGNSGDGVYIFDGATGNSIGGTAFDAGNTIADNMGDGVGISDSGTSSNLVQGNFIGTNANGDAGLGNTNAGVDIYGGTTANTVSGNTIADNGANGYGGVILANSGTSGNVVAGNTISGNANDGVDIFGGAADNTIGGTTAAAADVITSNGGDGVFISDPGTSGNAVEGDYIGTDASSDTGLGNADSGVYIQNGATANTVSGSTIADSGTGANYLGGVTIAGVGTSDNLIAGDAISGNLYDGVDIYGGATDNTIGGTTADAADTITNNTWGGVGISGTGTSGNVVEGDFIGTDAAGDTGLGNGLIGVTIFAGATGNTIGGSVAGSADTIASNLGGIDIENPGTSGNVVEGDFIGTNAGGATDLGNTGVGVSVFDGASGNTIGGAAANTIADNTGDGVNITGGSTTGATSNSVAGNLITSNGGAGIYISGSGTMGNLVAGNWISGNTDDGVDVVGGATGNTIGGTTAADANTIGGNGGDGVQVSGSGTSGNLVAGDYIGTDAGGTGLGNSHSGVDIFGGASANTVSGNTIADNGASGYGGIILANSGTSGNVVAGNTITGNVYDGVDIFGGATDNTIGGTTAADANTITSNGGGGLDIGDSGTSGNVVEGDYIGTDAAGDAGLGNVSVGLTIYGGATDNTIGGTTAAAAVTIDSNGAGGIDLENSGTTGNVVEGDFIGTDAAGDTGLGNSGDGVLILGGASDNTIGAGNVIAANTGDGVGIVDAGTGNVVTGNDIGTDAAGDTGLGNANFGVNIYGGASANTVSVNTIADNGANGDGGIGISGVGTSDNVVEGNAIADNVVVGVVIFGGATGNTIGGTSSADADTITGNGSVGVEFYGSGTSGNVEEGDFIGTDAAGDTGLGNGYVGVFVGGGATDNTIGGTADGSADTIAGNGTAATGYVNLEISDAGTSGNVVEGNYIGTNVDSAAGLNAPLTGGVLVGYGATGNTIGGSTAAARNIISGNTFTGVEIYDAGAAGNTVEGNYIGTNVGGTDALGNARTGVLIVSDSTTGAPTSANMIVGNVISGNDQSGVAIENAAGNVVADNLIGTDADGTAALGNAWDGVRMTEYLQNTPPNIGTGAPDNTIVGNTIAANGLYGVLIEYPGSTGNVVQGNDIGTVMGNALGGVMIDLGASGNTIGFAGAAASPYPIANVISGNGGPGVTISDSGTSSNVVAGNFIGVLADGATGLDNMGDGVSIVNGATGNTVGGTTAAAANTIANNTGDGVGISGTGTSGNIVEGNFIGTNSAGATTIGNSGDGVRVVDGASENTVGGTAVGAGNIIAYNLKGVVVGSSVTDTTVDDAILGNSIFANTALGIDLADNGVTLNDSSGHTGPNLFQDFPVIASANNGGSGTTITGMVTGPANSTLRIELFSSPTADPSGYGQGQVFLGAVMVTTGVGGGGTFTFTTSSPVAVGQVVTATATDASGDTSEFARAVAVTAIVPLDIGYQITAPLYNPIKHTYSEVAKLTNDGSTTTPAFEFVLEGLTAGVTLTNATGTTGDGSPYILIGALPPGQSVTVTLVFTKTSSSLFISYTPEFVPYSGPPA